MFLELWAVADKKGCLKNRPQRIAADLFPYEEFYTIEGMDDIVLSSAMGLRYENDVPLEDRHSENDVPSEVRQKYFIRPSVYLEKLLEELQNGGFSELYTDGSGVPAMHVKKFTTHQKLTSWERNDGKPAVGLPQSILKEMTSRHFENDATSSGRHSEYTEYTEITEVAEGAEGDLRLQIIRFKKSHPDCAKVPDAVVENSASLIPRCRRYRSDCSLLAGLGRKQPCWACDPSEEVS